MGEPTRNNYDKRTITYTFTPSTVNTGATLTYYDDTAANGSGLDSAGWYFSGTIEGTVAEYINGNVNGTFSYGSSSTYTATNVLVEVSLSDTDGNVYSGEETEENSVGYTATFILCGNSAVDSGTAEHVTAEWNLSLSASATGTTNGNSISSLFASGVSCSVVP